MRAAAALCLLAAMLAGCGAAPKDSAKKFKGEPQAVAKSIEQLETAGSKDKPADVCSKLLSAKLLGALEKQGTNCRTAVKEAFKDADSFDITVDKVTVTGTTATAKVQYRSLSNDKNATLLLDKEGSAWKISSLGSLSS
jgi:coenzyme F420-reducing hydrogenase beta subunit